MSNNEYRVPEKPKSGTFGPLSDKSKVTIKLGALFGSIGMLFGLVVGLVGVSFTLGSERSNALNRIDNIAQDVAKLVSQGDSQEGRLRTLEQTYSVGQQNSQRLDALERRMYDEDKATNRWRTEISERLARIEVAVGVKNVKESP